MTTKNYARSVRAKLLNISKEENVFYQSILTRYFQERLLYRLSVSPYKERFILKGGALLYAHEHLKARPTLDIDFLGQQISRELDNIKETFRKLCDIECQEDGVVFDKDSINVEEITLKKEYNGVRVHVKVGLDTASQVISMDVGFGDIITPAPVDLSYPVLLDTLPEVDILAYSLETVVAEKYQAMIDHATENSRMKDFFDVYRILKAGNIDLSTLQEAITATFENRGTAISTDYSLFEDSFATDAKRNIMWNSYLKKIKFKELLTFQEVWTYITQELKLYMEK